MFAARNLRLCTKDCLCLYVCPTGAADTENGQIDFEKCTGCGVCVNACPSGALSLVPDKNSLPPQQPKSGGVTAALRALAQSKARQEAAARALAATAKDPVLRQLAQAVERSNRLMAEDLLREAGYMLPQSGSAHALLQDMLQDAGPDFPAEAAKELLKAFTPNDTPQKEEAWRCTVCGYIHEGPLPKDFKCPRCGMPASVFVPEN
ncbi:MAG: 4Fe-4S binding protein [Oscillospiraceae bacterium]|nr:4Fe-4S binding protein [Oscillospiraceae bacterium]